MLKILITTLGWAVVAALAVVTFFLVIGAALPVAIFMAETVRETLQ